MTTGFEFLWYIWPIAIRPSGKRIMEVRLSSKQGSLDPGMVQFLLSRRHSLSKFPYTSHPFQIPSHIIPWEIFLDFIDPILGLLIKTRLKSCTMLVGRTQGFQDLTITATTPADFKIQEPIFVVTLRVHSPHFYYSWQSRIGKLGQSRRSSWVQEVIASGNHVGG